MDLGSFSLLNTDRKGEVRKEEAEKGLCEKGLFFGFNLGSLKYFFLRRLK